MHLYLEEHEFEADWTATDHMGPDRGNCIKVMQSALKRLECCGLCDSMLLRRDGYLPASSDERKTYLLAHWHRSQRKRALLESATQDKGEQKPARLRNSVTSIQALFADEVREIRRQTLLLKTLAIFTSLLIPIFIAPTVKRIQKKLDILAHTTTIDEFTATLGDIKGKLTTLNKTLVKKNETLNTPSPITPDTNVILEDLIADMRGVSSGLGKLNTNLAEAANVDVNLKDMMTSAQRMQGDLTAANDVKQKGAVDLKTMMTSAQSMQGDLTAANDVKQKGAVDLKTMMTSVQSMQGDLTAANDVKQKGAVDLKTMMQQAQVLQEVISKAYARVGPADPQASNKVDNKIDFNALLDSAATLQKALAGASTQEELNKVKQLKAALEEAKKLEQLLASLDATMKEGGASPLVDRILCNAIHQSGKPSLPDWCQPPKVDADQPKVGADQK